MMIWLPLALVITWTGELATSGPLKVPLAALSILIMAWMGLTVWRRLHD